MVLRMGISTCPNDTFIFGPLVLGFVKPRGFSLEFVMDDVEALNGMTLGGDLDVSKVSVATLPALEGLYEPLSCGGALSYEGPVVVSKEGGASIGPGSVVALPGRNTTAHLLFSIFHPDCRNKVFVRFDEIPSMVLDGLVDFGVLIHEGRFVCEDMGLDIVEDLGELWCLRTGLPIPLGVIVLKRCFACVKGELERAIRKSLRFSMNRIDNIIPFVKKHAKNMDDKVIERHIKTYVNAFTFDVGDLGRRAIDKVLLYKPKSL